jgi:hypothetical protein
MILLFFIEHFFLLQFIFIRDIVQKKKARFQKKNKENLPKKVLDTLIVT